MNHAIRILEIDRLRLVGLDVTPARAERIRALVEAELQHLLEQERWPENLTCGEISHLAAPPMQVARPDSDAHMASNLARSLAQSLRGIK